MRWHTRIPLGMALALACSIMKALASPPLADPIPLEKGWQWIYEGKVQWTASNSANVHSATLRWKMEVLDSVAEPGHRAAVVRGFPGELAWYEPGKAAGYTVLFSSSNRVYRLGAKDAPEAGELARRFVSRGQPLPPSAEEWLVLPLRKGSHWGGDNERDDLFYCWHMEDEKIKKLRVQGFSARQPLTIFTLGYRSLPDHQLFEIAPGLGIARYVFGHHGTVASADVRLVSVTRPAGSTKEQQSSEK